MIHLLGTESLSPMLLPDQVYKQNRVGCTSLEGTQNAGQKGVSNRVLGCKLKLASLLHVTW